MSEIANDNRGAANDNRLRKQRNYMALRRHGCPTQRELLRFGMAWIGSRAAADDLEAQTFVANVKEVLALGHAPAKAAK